MPEEIKKKRGRPPKQKVETIVETNTALPSSTPINEFNSFVSNGLIDAIFTCGTFNHFSKNEIHNILHDPIEHHEAAIRFSEFVYGKNGVVANSIDYMTALPCLDKIIISKSKKATDQVEKNKTLMKATLSTIDDKHFVRDALFTQMVQGIAFYYFETKKRTNDNNKFLTDFEVEHIYEINEVGINASIITLPYQYTKIVGKKNGRYVLAFDLKYFDEYDGESLKRKLRKYPKEIVDAYNKRKNKDSTVGDWYILDSDKTMCRKIKCKDSEPWGRSLIIAALEDVLYKDYFIDTKRNVLDEINNKIIYQTFPEGKDKGTCALTKNQQEAQHNTVKQAVMNKNGRHGISFFSVASGTKLDSIDVDVDIFDSKNESELNNQIALDLGVCSSLIGAMTTGNYAAGQANLEMITAQLYTWIYEWQNELNHVINKNIIQDEKNRVELFYFPTSFVNKSQFFDMMKSLYTDASGSFTFLVAASGVDPDVYMTVMDEEIENGIFEKYKPHQTAFTNSGNDSDGKGRPIVENPTNPNTIKTKATGSNIAPHPSDKK